jgi:hypothetical protein
MKNKATETVEWHHNKRLKLVDGLPSLS